MQWSWTKIHPGRSVQTSSGRNSKSVADEKHLRIHCVGGMLLAIPELQRTIGSRSRCSIMGIPVHSQQLTTRARQIAVLHYRRLHVVEIYIARNIEEVPAIDLKSRGRVKQRHGIGIERGEDELRSCCSAVFDCSRPCALNSQPHNKRVAHVYFRISQRLATS
jgi:hypothetical protein